MSKGRAAKNPLTGLTEQQERFTFLTVTTGRPHVAYRKAYDASNMQDNTIRAAISELLHNPAITKRISELKVIADRKLDVSVERIAVELARIGFFDPRDLFDDDGEPLPISELSEDAARAIAGLDVEDVFEGRGEDRMQTGRVKKYKIASKLKALELMANWKRMLVERVETGKPGEFDGLNDEELERQLAAEEAALAAIRKAAAPKAKKKTVAKS